MYYTAVNIGCVCILMLLLYSIKSLPTPLIKFRLLYRLVLWHILYFLSDSLWALVNDGIIPKNLYTVLAVNYSNAVIATVLAYSCFIFAEMSTRPEMTRSQIQRLQAKLRIPIYVEMVLLLVSFIATPGFWLDGQLEPRTIYYYVLLLIPFVYIMVVTTRSIMRGLKPQNRQNLKTYLIVASYTPGSVLAAVSQIFFMMTTPLFCFWCTIIILFVYLISLKRLISTDSLTSLNSRNQLDRYLQAQREPRLSFVIMVDINHFRQINDSYGHVEGDNALLLVSSALRAVCLRLCKPVFLCRYGGDEFMLIVPTQKPGDVVQLIRDCLQEEIAKRKDMQAYKLEVSVGYAPWDGYVRNFKDCVVAADRKMYEDRRSA